MIDAKTSVSVPQSLIDKFNKTIQSTKEELAKECSKTLVDEAKKSIDVFYDHYEPVSYRRKHNMKKTAFSGYRSPHKTTYFGGVQISAKSLNSDDYITFVKTGDTRKDGSDAYKATKVGPSITIPNDSHELSNITLGHILDLVYRGEHGNVEIFKQMFPDRNISIPPVMKPSPYERIYSARDSYISLVKTKGYIANKFNKNFK